MRKETVVMILFFVAFSVTYLFLLMPESEEERRFIPFSMIKMSLRSHVYFICERVKLAIFVSAAWYYLDRAKWFFDALFALQIVYLVDYLLFYHEPLIKIAGFPLSYSLFMGMGIAFLVTVMIIKQWK